MELRINFKIDSHKYEYRIKLTNDIDCFSINDSNACDNEEMRIEY